MKAIIFLVVILMNQVLFAKVLFPKRTNEGYTNPNGRMERQYYGYPDENIWHEFGRAYWRKNIQPISGTFVDHALEKKLEAKAVVNLNVQFKTGSSEILLTESAALVKFGKYLEENKNIKAKICGHTDNVGNEQRNLQLSKLRAQAVVDFLKTNFGITSDRLSSIGYGSAQPLEDNASEEGRRKNRRVEALFGQ